MPLEDALVVCAEEGRVYKHDIAGKLFNKRFTRRFPNGAIPFCESGKRPCFAGNSKIEILNPNKLEFRVFRLEFRAKRGRVTR